MWEVEGEDVRVSDEQGLLSPNTTVQFRLPWKAFSPRNQPIPPMSNTEQVDYSVAHPVPGRGKPMDYVPTNDDPLYVGEVLPTALLLENHQSSFQNSPSALLPMTTVREFCMLLWMNQVTDKPDWFKKVFDSEILAKWRGETMNAAGSGVESMSKENGGDKSVAPGGGGDGPASEEDEDNNSASPWKLQMTDSMFDHCVAELRYIAEHVYPRRNDGALVVYHGNVVKSDEAIPEPTKRALQAAVKPLETVPEKEKDWHPGSNDLVLDLVHPSLFPLIYGRSKILKVGEKVVGLGDCVSRCGEGEVLPEAVQSPVFDPEELPYSLKFQWLPCDVDISKKDGAKILSYINNLHPEKHAGLYRVIEKVIDAAIPLWELTLAPFFDKDFEYFQRIVCDTVEYEVREEVGPDEQPRYFVVQPEPAEFDAQNLKSARPIDIKQLYGGRNRPLQIMVKLANIELTPEKPRYKGGTWHVEGKLNEHICATALYYYSSDNIKPSFLAFNQFVDTDSAMDFPYEQNHHEFLEDIFGCYNDRMGVQYVGKIETREGRLITFPNILMHQVQPFELEDPSQKGHRKILALFLVDPNVRIVSTADVPCQQLDWWREVTTVPGLEKLPMELKDRIFDSVDGIPITLKDAKDLRVELMRERKKFMVAHKQLMAQRNSFSLCEH